MAGLVQQRVVEVGGEHLEFARAGRFLRRFHERHGDGIGLLAGGTAEHPDAHRFVAALLEELGENFALEHVEHFGVAEKARHADEHVGVERIQFLVVASKKPGVVLQPCPACSTPCAGRCAAGWWRICRARNPRRNGCAAAAGFSCSRPPRASTATRPRPAVRSASARACFRSEARRSRVRPRAAACRHPRARSRPRDPLPGVRASPNGCPATVRMLRNAGEFFRDVRRREHEIHAARRHRAARHRVVFGRVVLREGDAALGLDRLQPQRAVGGRAGQNHADGPLALVLRQRFKKDDRSADAACASACAAQASTLPCTMLRFVLGGMT